MSINGYYNEIAAKRRKLMKEWRLNWPDDRGKHWGELTARELAAELAA
jgi:hypothetical protein